MSLKILIIDDNAAVQELVTTILEHMNHQVQTVYDVSAGLARLETWTPDIIFCDLMMPVLNGLDFLKHRQTSPALQQIPVVLLTGTSDTEAFNEAYALGVNAVLEKPFGRPQIAKIIQQLVKES